MLSHALVVVLAGLSLTGAVTAQAAAALGVIKIYASTSSVSNGRALARRQLPTGSISDTCSRQGRLFSRKSMTLRSVRSRSCDTFLEAMTPCTSESDYSCTCRDETLRAFVACQQCQPIGVDDYPGGLPKLAQDAVDECRRLGFTVSDIDTSTLSATSRASTASATSSVTSASVSSGLGGGLLTATGTLSSSFAIGTGRPPNCAAICNSVCELRSARSKRQTVSDSMRDCMCTQAYFDSQYSCLACGTQLLGSDSLQRQGVDALKTLQETCQSAGYTGITTQDGLATFNPASTSFSRNSASSTSGSATTTPASSAGGPVAGGDTNNDNNGGGNGAGHKLSATPGGMLAVVGCMIFGRILL